MKEKLDHEKILNSLASPVFVCDKKEKVTYVNRALIKFFKKRKKDLLGKKFYSSIFKIKKPTHNCPIKYTLWTGKPKRKEVYYEKLDKHLLLETTSLKGKLKGCITIIKDVTKLRDKEQKVTKFKNILQKINDLSPNGIYITDKEGNCEYANDVWLEMAGMSVQQAKGKGWVKALCKEDRNRIKKKWKKFIKDGFKWNEQYRFCDKKGNVSWVQGKAEKIYDEEKNLIGVIGNNDDITKLVYVIKTLELYMKSVNQSSISTFWINKKGEFVNVNKAACEKLGYSLKELLKLNVKDVDPHYPKTQREKQWEKIKKNKTITFESQHKTKKGELIDVLVTSQYVKSGDKEYEFAYAKDITGWKKAVKELRISESKFKKAYKLAPFPIMMHTSDGKVLGVNKEWTKLSGYTQKDIPTIEKWCKKVYGKEWRKVKKSILNNYNEKVVSHEGEFKIKTKKGETLIWDFSTNILGNLNGKKIGLSIAHDVTERKESEEELMKSQQKLKKYKKGFDENPNSMVLVEYKDKKPKIRRVNKAFTRYYGHSEKAVKGKNPSVLKSGKQDKKYYKKMWKALLDPKNGSWQDDIVNQKKNGELIPVTLTITTIFEDKKPKFFIANHLDISKRAKTEKELRERLEQLEKFKEITVGREMKMIELKEKLKRCKK